MTTSEQADHPRSSASEELFRTLFEQGTDAVVLVDPGTGAITACNDAACDLLGLPRDRLLEMTLADLDAATSLEGIQTTLDSVIHSGSGTAEIRSRCGSGTLRDIVVSAFIIHPRDGDVIQCTLRDITKQKRIEQQLRDSNVTLSRVLTELKRTQQQVIQYERLNALAQMADGVAHDFNEVLTPIYGHADLLLRSADALDNREEVVAALSAIRQAAGEARDGVRRLRGFYSGSDERERQPVDVRELVESVLTLTRPRWREEASANGIHIEPTTDIEDGLRVHANPYRLQEALTNLVFNAVEAMPQGGRLDIRAMTRTPGESAVIEIGDTGDGMTEEVRQQCVTSFFTTRGDTRAGLGLTIVHDMLQKHGGGLEICSEPGKGTRILMALPLGHDVPEAEPAVPALELPPMRILCIDDEPPVLKVLKRALSSEGHTVETAGGGSEGLETFRASEFDLVITDRAMPDMSGDEVARTIKQIHAKFPVVMLTGFGDILKDKREGKGLPEGVDVVLGKPASVDEILQAIAEALAIVGR